MFPNIGTLKTILEISNLRNEWDRDKLLKLKSMARQNKKHWDKLKDFLI